MKGDERILGDGKFVEKVLKKAVENLERRNAIKAQEYDFNWLVRQVAEALDMQPDDVLAPSRYKNAVKARNVLCYWGTRELGLTTVELARRLHLSQPTVSQSAMRGRKIAVGRGIEAEYGSTMIHQWTSFIS
jgi:chromosomal replication initiation ATPase DnaA